MPKREEILVRKKVGDLEYKLWQMNSLYLISKTNWSLKGQDAHKVPVVFESHSEKEARKYFNSL